MSKKLNLIQNYIFQRFKNHENDTFSFSSSIGYYLLMGFFYLMGLVIYVAQCPERFKPGKFDIWVIETY